MIGNDIIDISYTRQSTDWQRPGWLEKVCTDKEISIVLNSKDRFKTVWRMWSMKESVYKLHIQGGAKHRLNPIQFETTIIDDFNGLVSIGTKTFQTITEINKKYISSVASDFSEELIYKVVSSNFNLKESLLDSFADTNNFSRSSLSFKANSNRVPQVYSYGVLLNHSISISHHGQYAAYAYSKNLNLPV